MVDSLLTHLRPVSQAYDLDIFQDSGISPGSTWDSHIMDAIANAGYLEHEQPASESARPLAAPTDDTEARGPGKHAAAMHELVAERPPVRRNTRPYKL